MDSGAKAWGQKSFNLNIKSNLKNMIGFTTANNSYFIFLSAFTAHCSSNPMRELETCCSFIAFIR